MPSRISARDLPGIARRSDEAWKSKGFASGQESLVTTELDNWFSGVSVAPYDAIRDLILHMETRYGWPSSDGNVLDVGCGVGHYSRVLRGSSPCVRYFGCDFSKEMIHAAKAMSECRRLSVCRAEELPYKDNSFDLVLLSGLLIGVADFKDWVRILIECRRVSKRWVAIHRMVLRLEGETVRITVDAYGRPCLHVYANRETYSSVLRDAGLESVDEIRWDKGRDSEQISQLCEASR